MLSVSIFPSQLASTLAPINEERTLLYHPDSGCIIRYFPVQETENPRPNHREVDAYVNSGLKFRATSPIPEASTIPGSVALLKSMYQYPSPETTSTIASICAALFPELVVTTKKEAPFDVFFAREKGTPVVRNAGLIAIQVIGCIREVGFVGQFEYGSFEGVRQQLQVELDREFDSRD